MLSRPNKAGADPASRAASLIGEVKRAIAQLRQAEGRLLSIRKELFGRARQLGKLLPAIKDRVGHDKWMIDRGSKESRENFDCIYDHSVDDQSVCALARRVRNSEG